MWSFADKAMKVSALRLPRRLSGHMNPEETVGKRNREITNNQHFKNLAQRAADLRSSA